LPNLAPLPSPWDARSDRVGTRFSQHPCWGFSHLFSFHISQPFSVALKSPSGFFLFIYILFLVGVAFLAFDSFGGGGLGIVLQLASHLALSHPPPGQRRLPYVGIPQSVSSGCATIGSMLHPLILCEFPSFRNPPRDQSRFLSMGRSVPPRCFLFQISRPLLLRTPLNELGGPSNRQRVFLFCFPNMLINLRALSVPLTSGRLYDCRLTLFLLMSLVRRRVREWPAGFLEPLLDSDHQGMYLHFCFSSFSPLPLFFDL